MPKTLKEIIGEAFITFDMEEVASEFEFVDYGEREFLSEHIAKHLIKHGIKEPK